MLSFSGTKTSKHPFLGKRVATPFWGGIPLFIGDVPKTGIPFQRGTVTRSPGNTPLTKNIFLHRFIVLYKKLIIHAHPQFYFALQILLNYPQYTIKSYQRDELNENKKK